MNLEPSDKNKKLTRFICQELLYEFISGHLDLGRQEAMDQYLTGCRDSQHELERLKRGLIFTKQMSKVHASQELRSALLGFEPLWKRRLISWTHWWSRRGWKALPYAVISTVLVLGLMITKPWQTLGQKDVVLVEQAKNENALAQPAAGAKLETPGPTPLEPEPPKPAVMAIVPAVIPPSAKPVVAEEEEAPPPKAEKRWVLRGGYEVTDFAIVWPAIRDKILALDGKPLGKGELGSARKKGEAYFHFTLPESKQEEFEAFLKTFGPVRFNKQADSRVMPEGENHIILTVKDGDPHEDGQETETP